MLYNHICPACNRYLGLWSRDGKLIACEWHNPRLVETSSSFVGDHPNIWLSRWLMWRVEHTLICRKGG